jgi:hypothetical protein
MKKSSSNQLFLATTSILGQPPSKCMVIRKAFSFIAYFDMNRNIVPVADLVSISFSHLLNWQTALLLSGLLVSNLVFAIDQIEIEIGELVSLQGKAEGFSATLDVHRNNQMGFTVDSQSLSLLPPYDALEAIILDCSEIKVNKEIVTCKDGHLTLTTLGNDPLTIPFDFKLASDANSGQLTISAIPLTLGHSKTVLNWDQDLWQFQPEINQFPLKPLANLLKGVGIVDADGLLSLNGNVTVTSTDLTDANLKLSGSQLSAQSEDATKAVAKLAFNSSIYSKTSDAIAQGQIDFKFADGELYLEPIYLPLNDTPISGDTEFLLDTENKHVQLSDFTLTHQTVFALFGSIQTTLEKSFPPDQGIINAQVYDLASLFNHYIAPYFSTNSVKPTLSETSGLILSELEFIDKQLAHLKLTAADLSTIYTFNNQDISINNAAITLNWRPENCKDQSFVYWKNAVIRGVPLPETVLRFKACGQQISFERNVTLPLLDGEMQFDHLDIKQLVNGGFDLSFATEINNISLAALSKAFDLPPLAGQISASIPSVRLENGGLRMDSSIHINVFGGEIEIQQLQIDGMLGSYPVLTTDIKVNNLDLGKLSRRFSFGNIEGKLSGTINGLRIENQKVIAFDAEFSTPKNRLLPNSISQKAVENIASLGGSGPGDILSRGVLKLFESFFYSRLGFSCKLRNNVCELKGVASAKNNGFYLIKGFFAPQINVIGYNRRVNWGELATRLKRITSESAPVVE